MIKIIHNDLIFFRNPRILRMLKARRQYREGLIYEQIIPSTRIYLLLNKTVHTDCGKTVTWNL